MYICYHNVSCDNVKIWVFRFYEPVTEVNK